MTNFFTREMLGQRSARRLLLFGGFLDRRGDHGRGGGHPLGLVGLQTLDRQLELLDLARQLLRRAPELGPPVTRQLEPPTLDQNEARINQTPRGRRKGSGSAYIQSAIPKAYRFRMETSQLRG